MAQMKKPIQVVDWQILIVGISVYTGITDYKINLENDPLNSSIATLGIKIQYRTAGIILLLSSVGEPRKLTDSDHAARLKYLYSIHMHWIQYMYFVAFHYSRYSLKLIILVDLWLVQFHNYWFTCCVCF